VVCSRCCVLCRAGCAPVRFKSSYWVLRRVLEFIVLLRAGEDAEELEIVVLYHQLTVLLCQVARPELGSADRVVLAGLSRMLPRARWSVFFVRPETLLVWHRQLVKRRWS
jgi:putative transposase